MGSALGDADIAVAKRKGQVGLKRLDLIHLGARSRSQKHLYKPWQDLSSDDSGRSTSLSQDCLDSFCGLVEFAVHGRSSD
jgi:hypothetical protein